MGRRRQKSRPSGEKGEAVQLAMRQVREVYADLEARPVDRDCIGRTECCRFRLTGRTPQLTRGEALVTAAGWRASGRKLPDSGESQDGACPFLGSDGRCQVYQHRPFGCRTHFCAAAGGMRDRAEVIDLIRRLETIDESLDGEGPKAIQKAVEEAWSWLGERGNRKSRK